MNTIRPIDVAISNFMFKHGQRLLRYSLAVIFIWFGALKPFGLSPAGNLVERTVFWFSPDWFLTFLGIWEVAIGIGLLFRPLLRITLLLLFLQMVGTFMPIVVLPEVVFKEFPHVLTLEGQYIIKNFIIIAAALVIGGSVRGASTEAVQL